MSLVSTVSILMYDNDYDRLQEMGDEFNQTHYPPAFFTTHPADFKSFKENGRNYIYMKYDYIKYYDHVTGLRMLKEFVKDIPHSLIVISEDEDNDNEEYRIDEDLNLCGDHTFLRLKILPSVKLFDD